LTEATAAQRHMRCNLFAAIGDAITTKESSMTNGPKRNTSGRDIYMALKQNDPE